MKIFTLPIKVLLCCLLFFGQYAFSQDPAQYGTPFSGVPDPRDANIYQVGVGEFSSTRNFQGVINRLDSIKALGINVIYLMPIYPIGILNASGSPYCIQNFTGVNSSLGTLTDLQNLVSGAHSRGMAVILDWVANQTSWDHPWITAHPDWYQQDANGNILQAGSFPDCAALNYSSSAMTSAMISAMRYWVFAANIDGYRCDWADNAPESYWSTIISNLRGITTHKLLMLAEGSNDGTSDGCTTCGQNQPGYHYAEGFDYIFGENFYWNVTKAIYLDGAAATVVDAANTADYIGASSTQLVARYMTNHDEYGNDGSPFIWMGGKAPVLAQFVVSAYMKGVPFIYNGEEVGNTSTLVYPWNTGSINWTQDYSVLSAMKQILAFRNSSQAIRQGTLTSYDTQNIIAFSKASGSQNVFVVVNVRNANETVTLPSGIANTTMYNAFTNTSVSLGSSISLTPYQYLVYTNSIVNVTGVTVSPTTASIAGTGTRQLTATVTPSNATNQNVTWASSNTGIATVNASGLVIGVAPGTATITVTTVDQGKTATSTITVTSVAVTGVNVSPATATLYSGGTTQLTATVTPSNATNQSVSWTSSNTSVATVSSNGLVTAVAAGTATITAKTADGSKTAASVITVQSVPSFTVYFYKPSTWNSTINVYWWSAIPSGTLADGTWPGVSMTSIGNNWYSYTFTYITSTNLIFDDGHTDGTDQTANLSRGTTGWYMDGTWYDSEPNNVTVTGVTVSPTSSSITVSGTQQLTATVSPSNATNQSVTWSSSNTAVATVSSTGLVAGVAAGSTTITVTTTDQGKTATCAVTVTVPTGPYTGTPAAIPGTIEAENYDLGGEGVAYHDNDAANQGGQYRNDGVDIEVCSQGGYDVGWTNTGEWLNYTVNVATAGNYNISAQVASATGSTGFHILFGGVNKTGTLAVANSGGWQNWQTVSVSNIALSAGIQVMEIYEDGGNFNINNLTFTQVTTVLVTGVTVSPTSSSIAVGGTQQLTATVSPSNATNQGVAWTSSNTSVATVSSTGLVTGIAAGTATITVTTSDQGKTATCAVTVSSNSVTYYQILNRWQANTYLKDGGSGQVTYGTNPSGTDYSYQWQQVSVGDGSGCIYIQNRSTGNYMHIQDLNGSVECGSIQTSWWSAMWTVTSVGSGWDYLENRWQTGDWVHIENLLGYAQYASPQTGWYSAEWEFVNGTTKSAEEIDNTSSDVASKVTVYPNPTTNGMVHIKLPFNSENSTLKIFDLEGRELASQNLTDSNASVDISSLKDGLYILKISTPSGIFTQKLMVK